MKILLREDVENLGYRGDIVSVAVGYARNYLLPQRMALEATAANLKTIEQQRKKWEAQAAKDADAARAVAARIAELRLDVSKKAGESETLYGSVTSSEIAELLQEKGIKIDRRKIQLKEPIKSLGAFRVPIKLHREVTAEVQLEVVAEAPETED